MEKMGETEKSNGESSAAARFQADAGFVQRPRPRPSHLFGGHFRDVGCNLRPARVDEHVELLQRVLLQFALGVVEQRQRRQRRRQRGQHRRHGRAGERGGGRGSVRSVCCSVRSACDRVVGAVLCLCAWVHQTDRQTSEALQSAAANPLSARPRAGPTTAPCATLQPPARSSDRHRHTSVRTQHPPPLSVSCLRVVCSEKTKRKEIRPKKKKSSNREKT